MTYTEIQDIMNISAWSLTRILHDCLGVRKRCTRWVPLKLSEEQKRGRVDWCTHMLKNWRGKVSRLGHRNRRRNLGIPIRPRDKATVGVWVFPDENPPVKFKRNRGASEQLIACFFATFGHFATIPLENWKTVTAGWYVSHCLAKVCQAWCKLRPQTGVFGLLLHHDNASAHTTAVTLDSLGASDVQLVTHPPYSSDLAHCDWFLFPSVKKKKKSEAKAVSKRQRCPSILRGRNFGHTPVNVVGCHRQLVWEDGQMCTGWGGFLRKTGVDRKVVSVIEKTDCKTWWVTLVVVVVVVAAAAAAAAAVVVVVRCTLEKHLCFPNVDCQAKLFGGVWEAV